MTRGFTERRSPRSLEGFCYYTFDQWTSHIVTHWGDRDAVEVIWRNGMKCMSRMVENAQTESE
ncbi:hypothetical protein [Streptomyces narbonensis]|uniref:hypothetical protein n=1 Tax=Streptomyces narbonensis TaxID=67333 RepID=UPI0033D03428